MKVLDTSIVVELVRKRSYEAGAISIITLIEVLRGVKAEKISEVKKLLEEAFKVLTLDNKVIETYGKLKEESETIPDADLLIAATAISHNTTLKTEDKHFQRLKNLGLKLES